MKEIFNDDYSVVECNKSNLEVRQKDEALGTLIALETGFNLKKMGLAE